jgi:hypothetical protein
MNPIRHKSPKTQNSMANNFFNSPKRNEINIINFNSGGVISNHKNFNINNNHFNYNYNKNDYNYYDEIAKAFNFITFVLKQNDNQIKELKIKIEQLQKQLNNINETNIMTFNNKDINEFASTEENFNKLNSNMNGFKSITFNYNQNKINMLSSENSKKYKQMTHNILSTQIGSSMNNINQSNILNKTNDKLKNKNNENNNSLNIIGKIKNLKNVYIYNNNNNYKNKYESLESLNNQINLNVNINEHSSEKNNINPIKKGSYHNINLRNRNGSGGKFINFNTNYNDNDVLRTKKMKIVNFDHSLNNLGKDNSRSNSFNLSDDGNTIQSKKEVKKLLKEIKGKLKAEKFKIFITYIKYLINNKNSDQKSKIIFEINNLLADKNLIAKFENIMKIKQ